MSVFGMEPMFQPLLLLVLREGDLISRNDLATPLVISPKQSLRLRIELRVAAALAPA